MGPGAAAAESGPTRITPISTRAIEPPPAPISTRSMAWMFIGIPLPAWRRMRCSSNSRIVCGVPSTISESLAVVPPMSKATRSAWPVSFPYAAAISAPAAGPDSIMRTGNRAIVSAVAMPPARLHDEEPSAVAEPAERRLEALEVVAHRGHHVRVDDGRRGPLVLADDRRHFRGETDRDARRFLTEDLGGAPLVRRIDVGVKEADGDRLHPVPDQRPDRPAQTRLVEGDEDLAVEGDPLADLADARARDQRGGLLDEEVVELVALLAADDEDVAEAPGREERDVSALPLDDDVRAEGRAVHRLREIGPIEAGAGDQLVEPVHARPRRVVRSREALAGEETSVVGLERKVGEGSADVEPDPERHAGDSILAGPEGSDPPDLRLPATGTANRDALRLVRSRRRSRRTTSTSTTGASSIRRCRTVDQYAEIGGGRRRHGLNIPPRSAPARGCRACHPVTFMRNLERMPARNSSGSR